MERLQKSARRPAWRPDGRRKLIIDGRVTVNGATVRELGTKADPSRDEVRVDGRRIKIAERRLYMLLNKSSGMLPHEPTRRSAPR